MLKPMAKSSEKNRDRIKNNKQKQKKNMVVIKTEKKEGYIIAKYTEIIKKKIVKRKILKKENEEINASKIVERS